MSRYDRLLYLSHAFAWTTAYFLGYSAMLSIIKSWPRISFEWEIFSSAFTGFISVYLLAVYALKTRHY